MRLTFFNCWIGFCCLTAASSTGGTNTTVQRTKRDLLDGKYLIFPEGSNVQLVYCLTISAYTKISGFSAFGVTAGQAWELPSKSVLSTKFEDYHRRSRRQLYRKVELLLGSRGVDGKACVLKAICNAANRDQAEIGKATFLEEIIHAVFTLPSDGDTDPLTDYERTYLTKENCNEVQQRCPDLF